MAFSPTTTILTTRSSQSVAGDAAVADHGIGRVVDALRRLKSRSWRTVMENLAARDASKHLAKRHMRGGAIAGTVVGVVIAIGLLVLCLYPVVVHQLKRRRNAAHPTFDAEAAMAAEADSSAAAASGSHRRLSSSDSLKQSGNLTRGQNGIERESKELEWNASRDNEALSGSRAVFGHPDSFSMDGATDETYDYAATNSFRPQPAPFLPLQCYDGEFAPPVADDDQPGVLKGTSADYYSPSIPSEAFGMITQPTMAANPPVHSPSRGSSLRYNVKQMFRRKSGRDRTLSSTTSPTEHTGSMPSAAVPHLEGATPMQHIITDGHHVESPTNVSPTSMTMPDFPASQASQAPMSPPSSSSPDAMVKTPPLSPFSERQARKAPSPPMYAAPGTVNPMDIMPASTESEVWHRTEHQLYTSTNETTKPQPNDYDSTMPSPSPTPPDSQDLATELLAQPFTATDQGFTYTTDPAEPTYAVDSVMPDVPDYHHLHPTASPEGRHPSYPSEHSTPYPGHAFTDVSSQNTPSTQIDSPSPQSLGSSDFRHSVSPQPVLSVPSPKNGVFHCDEPGCQQVFDQPHKLKHHQRYHSKDHKCPYAGCGKGFGTKTHLQRHINDRHEKKKKFHCSVAGCDYSRAGGKAFPRKDNWKRHMTKIHNMDQQQLPEPVEVDLDMSGT